MKRKSLFKLKLVALILMFSCSEGFLDRKPLDIISDEVVWTNESAIQSYLAGMYDDIFVEHHDWKMNSGFLSHYTDEAMRSYSWGHPYTPTFADGFLARWEYTKIRKVNEFLEKITETDINDDLKNRFIAEAHFIRAFDYFVMAKRYGGVPIIKQAQVYTGDNIQDLKLPRNTEIETWNFIAEECDLAIAGLPEAYDATEQFKATKYSAYALKSRAMLYAGSISRYGLVQLDGLIGIPTGEANNFFQSSLVASEAIINSGKYALYEKNPDKADNFQELFLDKTLHEEAIFVKAFSTPDKPHSFDYYNAAPSFKIDWGTNTGPTLELVEEFEYVDGSEGTLRTNDDEDNPVIYDNPEDIFKNKDPRFFASILYPNSPWQGNYVEIRRGIIGSDDVKVEATAFGDKFPENPSLTTSGKDGLVLQGDCSRTGFYLKKYMDPSGVLDQNRSATNFLVFRYAEILLNYAEAAIELDRANDALPKLNQVLARAGVAEKTSVTLEDVRHERAVELAFENLRYWDLIRWRIADQVMNNTTFSALIPWLDYKTGKYIFEKEPNILKLPKTFLIKNYYQPIPGIAQNELLVQNPGY